MLEPRLQYLVGRHFIVLFSVCGTPKSLGFHIPALLFSSRWAGKRKSLKERVMCHSPPGIHLVSKQQLPLAVETQGKIISA